MRACQADGFRQDVDDANVSTLPVHVNSAMLQLRFFELLGSRVCSWSLVIASAGACCTWPRGLDKTLFQRPT